MPSSSWPFRPLSFFRQAALFSLVALVRLVRGAAHALLGGERDYWLSCGIFFRFAFTSRVVVVVVAAAPLGLCVALGWILVGVSRVVLVVFVAGASLFGLLGLGTARLLRGPAAAAAVAHRALVPALLVPGGPGLPLRRLVRLGLLAHRLAVEHRLLPGDRLGPAAHLVPAARSVVAVVLVTRGDRILDGAAERWAGLERDAGLAPAAPAAAPAAATAATSTSSEPTHG
jgi:hypothetical protein